MQPAPMNNINSSLTPMSRLVAGYETFLQNNKNIFQIPLKHTMYIFDDERSPTMDTLITSTFTMINTLSCNLRITHV